MPLIDFAEVRERIDLRPVLVYLYWEPFKFEPTSIRGPCPVCCPDRQRSRSFCVTPDWRRWYCQRCKEGGDVIDLWAAVKGLSLGLAAFDLCQCMRVAVPYHRDRFKKSGTEKRNGQDRPGPG